MVFCTGDACVAPFSLFTPLSGRQNHIPTFPPILCHPDRRPHSGQSGGIYSFLTADFLSNPYPIVNPYAFNPFSSPPSPWGSSQALVFIFGPDNPPIAVDIPACGVGDFDLQERTGYRDSLADREKPDLNLIVVSLNQSKPVEGFDSLIKELFAPSSPDRGEVLPSVCFPILTKESIPLSIQQITGSPSEVPSSTTRPVICPESSRKPSTIDPRANGSRLFFPSSCDQRKLVVNRSIPKFDRTC